LEWKSDFCFVDAKVCFVLVVLANFAEDGRVGVIELNFLFGLHDLHLRLRGADLRLEVVLRKLFVAPELAQAHRLEEALD
jgi:hypothetical protein